MRSHRFLRAGVLPVLGAAGLSLLISGCSTPPSDVLLLKENPAVPDTYRVPRENGIPFAKNIVYVPDDSRFSLGLESINTGWLHQRQAVHDAVNPLSARNAPPLAGKDLWVVVNARSLSAGDTLGLEARTISRALVVKYNMRSFGLIPLTTAEKTLFSLEADTDYEVSLRIYEVDSAAFKRFAAGYYHGNPGLSGIAIDAWGTVRSVARALAGESGLDKLNTARAGALPVEHMLRETGAVLRFDGEFAIYRDGTRLAPSRPDGVSRVLQQRYVLVEAGGRKDTAATSSQQARADDYIDGKGYLARLETAESADSPKREDAFVRFAVDAIWSPVRKARQETKQESEALATAPSISPAIDAEDKVASFAAADRVAAAALQAYLKAAEAEKQAVLEAHETMQRTGPGSEGPPPEALETALLAASTKAREAREARSAWEEAKATADKQRKDAHLASTQHAQIEVNKEAALAAGQAFEAAVREAADKIAESAKAQQDMWRARREAEDAGSISAAKDLLLATAIQTLKNVRAGSPQPDTAAVAAAEKAVTAAQEESRAARQSADAKAVEAAEKASAVVSRLAAVDKAEAALAEARRNKENADATVNQTADQTLPVRLKVLEAPGL